MARDESVLLCRFFSCVEELRNIVQLKRKKAKPP